MQAEENQLRALAAYTRHLSDSPILLPQLVLQILKAILPTHYVLIGNHLANELRSSFAQARCKECAALRQDAKKYSGKTIGEELEKEGYQMANQQQLDLLKQGVATTWNLWREEHPDSPINLNGVDLSEANLGEVNLAGADLSRANLSRADLNNANLSQARLAQADLSGANLAEADLSDADLSEANLSKADLIGANLTGANLTGADMREALLE
jgi:hypothetical protein